MCNFLEYKGESPLYFLDLDGRRRLRYETREPNHR
jgi:hypothetical protein